MTGAGIDICTAIGTVFVPVTATPIGIGVIMIAGIVPVVTAGITAAVVIPAQGTHPTGHGMASRIGTLINVPPTIGTPSTDSMLIGSPWFISYRIGTVFSAVRTTRIRCRYGERKYCTYHHAHQKHGKRLANVFILILHHSTIEIVNTTFAASTPSVFCASPDTLAK